MLWLLFFFFFFSACGSADNSMSEEGDENNLVFLPSSDFGEHLFRIDQVLLEEMFTWKMKLK
jgi:hypothetical protein